MTSSAIDRHLAALLPTFDLFDAEHEDWKYDAFAYARAHCPVVRTEAELTGPMWMVTRYADVRRVLEDPESGRAWVVQPNRVEPFRFPGVPGPR